MSLDRIRTSRLSGSSVSSRPGAVSPQETAPSAGGTGNSSGLDGARSVSLQDVFASIERIRRAAWINQFLQYGMKWSGLLLIVLLIAAAFTRSLAGILVATAVLLSVGAVASLMVAKARRPSPYRAACLLDSATGLRDRVSTAIYFSQVENPDGMVLCQRRDALKQISQVNAAPLFHVRMPAFTTRLVILIAIVAGFLGYRANHAPPMTRLIQRTADSRLAKAVIAPRLKDIEKDLLAAVGLDKAKPEEETTEAGDPQSAAEQKSADMQGDISGDESQTADDNMDQNGKDAEQPADMSNEQQNASGNPQEGQPTDSQAGSPSGNGQQQQQQDSSQKTESQNADAGQQSLSQTLMQALKNMISKATGQQSGQSQGQNSGNSQPNSDDNASASANSANQSQQGPMDAKGNKDSQQGSGMGSDQSTPKSGEGTNEAGKSPGSNLMQKNAALDANASPDQVDLNYEDPRGGARVRASAGPGSAQVPLTDASPDPVAAVNGAEQESIPLRYRLYVQHYFDHAEKPQH